MYGFVNDLIRSSAWKKNCIAMGYYYNNNLVMRNNSNSHNYGDTEMLQYDRISFKLEIGRIQNLVDILRKFKIGTVTSKIHRHIEYRHIER